MLRAGEKNLRLGISVYYELCIYLFPYFIVYSCQACLFPPILLKGAAGKPDADRSYRTLPDIGGAFRCAFVISQDNYCSNHSESCS